MAKKITLAVLIVLLLGGAWWQNAFINGATERLTAPLAKVRKALEKEDFDEAHAAAETFLAMWEKEKQTYEALFDHDDIDMISAIAKRMKSYCSTRFGQAALAETHALLFYINHLRDIDNLGWENIF